MIRDIPQVHETVSGTDTTLFNLEYFGSKISE